MISTSLRSIPSSLFSYAELLSRSTSKVIDLDPRKTRPDEARHGSLVNLPNVLAAIFTTFRRLLLWGAVRSRRLLVSTTGCHASFITAPTPGSAHKSCAPHERLEGVRCQFSRSGKHDMSHVGDDVTDTDVIEDWWYFDNYLVCNLASMVWISH